MGIVARRLPGGQPGVFGRSSPVGDITTGINNRRHSQPLRIQIRRTPAKRRRAGAGNTGEVRLRVIEQSVA